MICVPQLQFNIKCCTPYSQKELMSAPREDGCIGEGEEASHVFAELNQHDKIH